VLDRQWDEAIRHAAASASRTTVFVEWREDLSAAAASAEHPAAKHTVWAGTCVERPDRSLIFHSGLLPDQLEDLLSGKPPRDAAPAGQIPLEIDPGPAVAAVTGAIVEAQRRLPEARFRARWVEFDQRVKIGYGGAVFDDRRSTRRIRIDASLERHDRAAMASAERVIQNDNNYISVIISETIERLEARLDAADPVAGPTTVVFAPAIAGIWIHELVGHAAEADLATRGRSWLTPDIDSLPEGLTVIDDPRRARASWKLDDEGTPTRPVALIHEGRPKELLHSRRTASESGCKTTGHGRRGSYREPILPRMGCTFIANGTDDPNEIIQNVQEGIYVRRMESAHTDPTTGRAVFRVTDADRITCGKLAAPLQPHLLETVAGETLAAIEGIGHDLLFDRCIGTCHRKGQPLSTSVGAPTICTRLMTVRF
jgi:predicted Zn-dependent protease